MPRLIPTVVLALAALMLPSRARADSDVRTVALSENAPINLEPGQSVANFFFPFISNSGKVSLQGALTGPGIDNSNDRFIMSEDTNGLSLVARKGDPVPDAPGFTFRSMGYGSIGESGETLFQAYNEMGVNSSHSGIYRRETGGAPTKLVSRGDVAPGTNGTLAFISLPGTIITSNAVGQAAFRGNLAPVGSNFSNSRGLFRETRDGQIELVAHEDFPTPVPGTDLELTSPFNHFPVLNDHGEIAYRSYVVGPGVDFSNNAAVVTDSGGNGMRIVAREGLAAPGTGAGVVFDTFRGPKLNNAGQILFRGMLAGTGVTEDNDDALFSEGAGAGLQLLAREGDNVPGQGPEVTYGEFDHDDFSINRQGQAIFQGELHGLDGVGTIRDTLLSEGGGNGVELIARGGAPAPDVGAGINFLGFFDPKMNGRGQAAFRAQLTGTGVNNSNNRALFAQETDGTLRLVARTGDQLDVSDDPQVTDLRTIQSLTFGVIESTGNEDGRASVFNETGQAVFSAQFTDGSSGVFVSDLVASFLPGDFDFDSDADGADFLAWQRTDRSTTGLAEWQQNYDNTAATVTLVPEPSSCAILALAYLLSGCSRRRCLAHRGG